VIEPSWARRASRRARSKALMTSITLSTVKPLVTGDSLMGTRLPIDPDALAALCRRYHIRKLSLFGSQLKGTALPGSDVDLLVEFEAGSRTTLLTMAQIELELSPLLGGRKVDLRTEQDLSRYFRDEVVRSAEPQYVAR
jgi:predicted nucleotidyltransferase